MLRDLLLFVKYPYAAIIIATMWLGTAALIAIDRSLPVVEMVMINMVASCVIAIMGFQGKKDL